MSRSRSFLFRPFFSEARDETSEGKNPWKKNSNRKKKEGNKKVRVYRGRWTTERIGSLCLHRVTFLLECQKERRSPPACSRPPGTPSPSESGATDVDAFFRDYLKFWTETKPTLVVSVTPETQNDILVRVSLPLYVGGPRRRGDGVTDSPPVRSRHV